MSDGLPRLLPDDPQNHLSVEARKRIQRARLEAEKFVWEAEIVIEARHLDSDSPQAWSLRNKANFKKAKMVLSVFHREFSRISLPVRRFRQYMEDEIESASHSLQLSTAQQRLLGIEFFYPEEQAAQVTQLSVSRALPQAITPEESIAAQLQKLRDECRWTIEDLAEAAEISTRQVARHLSGQFKPHPRKISAYERAFSKRLKRQVVVRKMS